MTGNEKPAMTEQQSEALEALNKYREAYGEIYSMLGWFLDAEAGEDAMPSGAVDKAWTAFNDAPGDLYWERIESALSHAEGEATAWLQPAHDLDDNSRSDCITNERKQELLSKGGMIAASAENYSVPLYTHPAPAGEPTVKESLTVPAPPVAASGWRNSKNDGELRPDCSVCGDFGSDCDVCGAPTRQPVSDPDGLPEILAGPCTHLTWTPDRTPRTDQQDVVVIRYADYLAMSAPAPDEREIALDQYYKDRRAWADREREIAAKALDGFADLLEQRAKEYARINPTVVSMIKKDAILCRQQARLRAGKGGDES